MNKKLLFLLLLLPLAVTATAQGGTYDYDDCIDGIYYKFEGQKAIVKRSPKTYSGDIVIPPTVPYNGQTYVVSEIISSAFMASSGLNSVSIPFTITNIVDKAFSLCNNLKSVTMENGVTSIGKLAFENCYNLTNFTIPSTVTSINEEAFKNCQSLSSVILPEGITSIADGTFDGCLRLESIYIPSKVTSIGQQAFEYCESLTSINLPKGITSIADETFRDCISLSSIAIPEGVTEIGKKAFLQCTSLRTVYLPSSLGDIGLEAFASCPNLEGIVCMSTYAPTARLYDYVFDDTPIENATLYVPESSLYWYQTATSWKNFGSIQTNDRVYFNVGGILYYLGSINNKNVIVTNGEGTKYKGDIDIPATVNAYGMDFKVTGLSRYAFYGCNELTSVTIPEYVTYNGLGLDPNTGLHTANYFEGCTNLKTVRLNSNAIVSAARATNDGMLMMFGNQVQKYIIGNKVTSIGDLAFFGCAITSVEIPSSVKNIGGAAFHSCNMLETLTLPEGVETIGALAFCNCSSLTSATLPNSLTTLGGRAFLNCSSLTTFTVPDNITVLDEYMLSGCTSLMEVNLSNRLTQINNYAFDGSNKLPSITLPETVTSIGNYAFRNCTGLKEIWCNAVEPPVVYDKTFQNLDVSNILLVVPDGSEAQYKAHEIWGQFWIETPTGIKTIDNGQQTTDNRRQSIYNLAGQRLNKMQKGINIVGGRKVLK